MSKQADPKVEGEAPPPRNRRRSFTPETRETVVRWLTMGHFRDTACARARIDPKSLWRWLEQGRKDLESTEEDGELSDHARFYLDVEEAETSVESTMVGLIIAGSNEDLRWFLERRYPRRWGKMATRIEVTGADGGPVKVDDARRTLLGRLLAIASAGPAQEADPGDVAG